MPGTVKKFRRSRVEPPGSEFDFRLLSNCLCSSVSGDGRPCRQTSRANLAWTRLGVPRRGPEGVWRSRRRRCDFAQGRTRPPSRKRDLQLQVADCGAPLFAPETGARSRFLPAPNCPGRRVPGAPRNRSAALPPRLERERRTSRRDRRSLRRLSRPPNADARDGSAEGAYR